MNLELYINNHLCDIESPEKLGITLKRVFINPSELSIKDAQKSYDISLPATAVNNEIFNYANVEETQGKFKIYGDARLYVDGVLILDGKFRLSEITKDYYRGNLGVPVPITVKDIFGETMMNQAGKWMIPFRGVEDITNYNTGKYDKSLFGDTPPAIFPLVLYGLLNRDERIDKSPNREIFDNNVILDKDNLPPSVNCLQMLKRIFANANYTLTGSAMNDERLRNIFVSYKNPEEYNMLWSTSKMGIRGRWSNYDAINGRVAGMPYGDLPLNGSNNRLYTGLINLFDTGNLTIDEVTDREENIKITHVDKEFEKKTIIKFEISQDGLYKIEFDAILTMGDNSFRHYSGYGIDPGSLQDGKFELKLVRNYTAEQDFKEDRFDNVFYRDNIDQVRGEGNSENFDFPQKGHVNFIDPKQNSRFICGFSWGKFDRDFMADYYNPYNMDGIRANPMAISGGKSWDRSNVDKRLYSAVKSPGYRNGRETVSRFKVDIDNVSYPATEYIAPKKATGSISQIVWLEKGDKLSIIDMSNMTKGTYNSVPSFFSPHHTIEFGLSITPFQHSWQWLTIDELGASNTDMLVMDWKAEATFYEDEINLTKFLPADVKVNDWIENFCKAFNLDLIHKGGNNLEINIKTNDIVKSTSRLIDLDSRASVLQRADEPLRLPYAYELGFTVNTGEEGYYASITEMVRDEWGKPTNEKVITAGDNGGGKFYTGSQETSIVNQTSNFSYNWFKNIKNEENQSMLKLPVISEKEIWDRGKDYYEMIKKQYTNLPQRFWFHSGWFTTETVKDKGSVSLATVSEEYNGRLKLSLNYKDQPESIMRSFFLILADNNNNYTKVSCLLTPDEYADLGKYPVKLNGDLYNVAEVDGYDPLQKQKCTLKLIRRII